MGRNKQLRKRIAGQLRVIARHRAKIESELRRPAPDFGYIAKWRHEIGLAQNNVRKLTEQLEKWLCLEQNHPRSQILMF
jgi:hypothetical protein